MRWVKYCWVFTPIHPTNSSIRFTWEEMEPKWRINTTWCYMTVLAGPRHLGYPEIGHYDIWLIEELKLLYLSNHGTLLYPNTTNSSQYISTNESFDAVALQSISVDKPLKERCKDIENNDSSLPNLSRDLDCLSRASGSDLTYLPFSHA